MKYFFRLLICTLTFSSILFADWTNLRGPNYNGSYQEAKINFKGRLSKKWELNHGKACSAPVILDGIVINSGNKNDIDYVVAVNLKDGKEKWRFEYPCKLHAKSFEGGPRATPLIHKGYIYTFSWDGKLHCLNFKNGKKIWSVDVQKKYKGVPPRWGYSGSPYITNNKLFLDIGGPSHSTLCLDAKTGKLIWGIGNTGAGYSQPIYYKQNILILNKAKRVIGFDYKTKKELWSLDWNISYDVHASMPTIIGDKLLLSSGYGDGRAALYDIKGKQPKELWKNSQIKTKMNSCTIYKDLIFGVSERGGAFAAKLGSGEILWKNKCSRKFGTLIVVNDILVIISDKGLVTLSKAAPQFEEITTAQPFKERCWVTPVYSDGVLLFKSNNGQVVAYDFK